MCGVTFVRQDVVLHIETSSRSEKRCSHAEMSRNLIESWLDPQKFTLKSTIRGTSNVVAPESVEAFEVWVNGNLVHSEQQCDHGYLDLACDKHKEAVRRAIQDCLAGKRVVLPHKRGDSQIKADMLRMRMHQEDEDASMKRREPEEAKQVKQNEEVYTKKAKLRKEAGAWGEKHKALAEKQSVHKEVRNRDAMKWTAQDKKEWRSARQRFRQKWQEQADEEEERACVDAQLDEALASALAKVEQNSFDLASASLAAALSAAAEAGPHA